MIRHGIVVPGLGTPQQCGGPAWCAACNAEMIELETLALGCAAAYENRMGRDDTLEMLVRRWQHRSYNRQHRRQAMRLLILRAEAAERNAKRRTHSTAEERNVYWREWKRAKRQRDKVLRNGTATGSLERD